MKLLDTQNNMNEKSFSHFIMEKKQAPPGMENPGDGGPKGMNNCFLEFNTIIYLISDSYLQK